VWYVLQLVAGCHTAKAGDAARFKIAQLKRSILTNKKALATKKNDVRIKHHMVSHHQGHEEQKTQKLNNFAKSESFDSSPQDDD
jgi:hypothetical protein